MCCFFFFKHKSAYELRISDWISDACSSDLEGAPETRVRSLVVRQPVGADEGRREGENALQVGLVHLVIDGACRLQARHRRPLVTAPLGGNVRKIAPGRLRMAVRPRHGARKSDVSGESVSVSVDLGGRRLINK